MKEEPEHNERDIAFWKEYDSYRNKLSLLEGRALSLEDVRLKQELILIDVNKELMDTIDEHTVLKFKMLEMYNEKLKEQQDEKRQRIAPIT